MVSKSGNVGFGIHRCVSVPELMWWVLRVGIGARNRGW